MMQLLSADDAGLLARVRKMGERRSNWRAQWEAHKDGPGRWNVLRKIYAELEPELLEGRCDPYFIDWMPVFTPIESDMWHYIRALGLPFYPQYPVGRFFVDFADPAKKIAIECDGKQWHDAAKDAKRDSVLLSLGWRVMRFTGRQCYLDQDHPESAYGAMLALCARYFQDSEEAEEIGGY